MSKLIVGMIGFGVVGSSVLKALIANRAIINARAGKEVILKRVVVRDKAKAHKKLEELNTQVLVSDNVDDMLNDSQIEIIVELMGGVGFAYEIAKKALSAKKAFVTANKAMLAYHRYDIAHLANGVPVGFEASVCGGIPIIRVLKDGLNANHILTIRGILNGTSNYILTQMQNHKQDFYTALEQAQNLGYAEADPTLDISGGDAGHKLLILASLAYGINALPEQILIEGIEGIMPDDIEFACDLAIQLSCLALRKNKDTI